MPGFTHSEREFIANLCRYHRKAMPSPEHENLQQLDLEARRGLNLLIPLLRMADSLDRSMTQPVLSLECKVRESDVTIALNGAPGADIDLELWAAERLLGMFRQVYGKPVTVVRK
jgi:exopolyphosphatase/guanosine-5'-triphosphate,3'-diphosphate pyrophosphatase